jgi:hypothetical protein
MHILSLTLIKKWHHASINMFLTVTTIVINFILAFILLQTADWTIANEFGILQWLPKYHYGFIVIGLLLLDLIERILYTLSNTKLNSCGDFILSIIQILGWTHICKQASSW